MKSAVSNFAEICPVGAALIHADGQADVRELAGAFRLCVSLSVCDLVSVSTPLDFFFMKFDVRILYKNLLSIYDVCENRCSEAALYLREYV